MPTAAASLPTLTAPGPQCGGRYPAGQCTAGAAVMFPIVCSSPNLGNGGEWYGNAVALGWPNSPQPRVGWLASFNVAPPYGDVGLITAINGDGTVQRYGVNWHLDGQWSSDRVPIDYVIGSFLPYGAFVDPTGGPLASSLGLATVGAPERQVASGARGLACRFGWTVPRITIFPGLHQSLPLGQSVNVPKWEISPNVCLDGVVGVAAWAAGLACVAGAVLIAARRPVQRTAGRAAQVGGTATGQPEVVAAGTAARRLGERPRPRRARGLGGAGSPQEQETYRDIRSLGGGRSTYSPVQARRMAQAAGSGGTREERLRRALLSTQAS